MSEISNCNTDFLYVIEIDQRKNVHVCKLTKYVRNIFVYNVARQKNCRGIRFILYILHYTFNAQFEYIEYSFSYVIWKLCVKILIVLFLSFKWTRMWSSFMTIISFDWVQRHLCVNNNIEWTILKVIHECFLQLLTGCCGKTTNNMKFCVQFSFIRLNSYLFYISISLSHWFMKLFDGFFHFCA